MSVPPGRRSEAQGPPATTATGTATGVQRGGNGPSAASPAASPVAPRVRPREARQARFARSFAQVVAVLMRDPNFRTMPLADLEWLVLPAVMSGQFRVAEAPASLGPDKATDKARDKGPDKAPDKAKTGGVLVPVAVALWARVSGEIDKALAGSLDRPVRLKPHQWASGEHVWLVAVAGDRRAVPKLIERIASTELKGQRIKMRVKGTGNTVVVKTLGEARD
jgi:hemolysin-activating ACP:hemolysin acyltransferase